MHSILKLMFQTLIIYTLHISYLHLKTRHYFMVLTGVFTFSGIWSIGDKKRRSKDGDPKVGDAAERSDENARLASLRQGASTAASTTTPTAATPSTAAAPPSPTSTPSWTAVHGGTIRERPVPSTPSRCQRSRRAADYQRRHVQRRRRIRGGRPIVRLPPNGHYYGRSRGRRPLSCHRQWRYHYQWRRRR